MVRERGDGRGAEGGGREEKECGEEMGAEGKGGGEGGGRGGMGRRVGE